MITVSIYFTIYTYRYLFVCVFLLLLVLVFYIFVLHYTFFVTRLGPVDPDFYEASEWGENVYGVPKARTVIQFTH